MNRLLFGDGPESSLVVLTMGLVGVVWIFILWSSLDIAILRKYFLSGRFSLRTMFAVNTIAVVDAALYRVLRLDECYLAEQVVTVMGITMAAYVVLSTVMLWLQSVLEAKVMYESRRRQYPPTIGVVFMSKDKIVATYAGRSTTNIHPT